MARVPANCLPPSTSTPWWRAAHMTSGIMLKASSRWRSNTSTPVTPARKLILPSRGASSGSTLSPAISPAKVRAASSSCTKPSGASCSRYTWARPMACRRHTSPPVMTCPARNSAPLLSPARCASCRAGFSGLRPWPRHRGQAGAALSLGLLVRVREADARPGRKDSP
jgi:hypothetical protein